ncbi:MAG: hypothetical protein HY921_06090 [Elusimicrobia bacterium]|nr:hypothetical protein [Elusimicrobiota bacterium]
MRILGISLGDTATAAVMVDDRFAACASEERFSRLKRDESFPRRAIAYCLEAAGVEPGQLDAVAVAGSNWDFWRWLAHYHSSFSIEDLAREQSEYWRPLLYEGKNISWPKLFKHKWDLDQKPAGLRGLAERLGMDLPLGRADQRLADQFLDEAIAAHLGIDKGRIIRIDQHASLEAYAYWSSPFRGKGTGVIVLNAGREGVGASVAMPLRFGLMRLCSIGSERFRLAQLMRDVTLMLGLPPRDHDPVVMGLAAHAPAGRWRAAYRVFAKCFAVKDMEFHCRRPVSDTYFHFLDKLRRLPDDAIAGGVQHFVEDQIAEWVGNVVRCTHLPRLAIAGSLSMNHRVMAKIAQLKSVENLFVAPAAGEGTGALGACLQLATARFGVVPAPWTDCYLGPEARGPQAQKAITSLRESEADYAFKPDPSPAEVAKLLSEGAIIGRCAGRAEFGSRGLGNRSILADPRNARIAPFIAAKIKRREAHVQLSPTILESSAGRYLKNPKGIDSPFMTLAFSVKARASSDLAAAIDSDEGAVRPQVLSDGSNPEFAAILRAFEKLTGVGALLNTSLNAHGEPIALTADDAARVFMNSGLDYLLLGNTLVAKRSVALRRDGR